MKYRMSLSDPLNPKFTLHDKLLVKLLSSSVCRTQNMKVVNVVESVGWEPGYVQLCLSSTKPGAETGGHKLKHSWS